MLYRQQVKDVKRTEEETVKWLDNFDNYKQHKKTTLLVYWYYTIYVLLVKIKHLFGQYMTLRRDSSVNNFYKTAVKRQLSDNK